MAAPDGKLGDPYSSREETVRQMLAEIGRETSDLTFEPAALDASASLPDDPDVQVAWDCLRQVTAEVCAQFNLFNTYEAYINPDEDGRYVIPPVPPGVTWDVDVFRQPGTNTSLIASVKVVEQPAGMELVWRGTANTTYTLVNTKVGHSPPNGAVRVEVAYWMPWENIPFPYRDYIFIRAARRFARRQLGEGANIQLSAQDEFDALARVKKHRLRANRVSFQRGSLAWVNDRYPY